MERSEVSSRVTPLRLAPSWLTTNPCFDTQRKAPAYQIFPCFSDKF